MFDYRYGTPTKSFKWSIEDHVPKVATESSLYVKVISLCFRFLHGIEVASLSSVSRSWYSASSDPVLWLTQSKSIISDVDRYQQVKKEAEQKTAYLKGTSKQLAMHKEIYLNLLLKSCMHCGYPELKMRFLRIAKRSICYNCAKEPAYKMISHETAEVEYGVSKRDLNIHQISGLKVPHTYKPGKHMFVYYVKDIVSIAKPSKTSEGQPRKKVKLKLTTAEKTSRRNVLIERLQMMGVNTELVAWEDPSSPAFMFVEGLTDKELGPIAGEIWRIHKPEFIGRKFI